MRPRCGRCAVATPLSCTIGIPSKHVGVRYRIPHTSTKAVGSRESGCWGHGTRGFLQCDESAPNRPLLFESATVSVTCCVWLVA